MLRAEQEGKFPAGREFACNEQDCADTVPLPVRRRPSLPERPKVAAASLPLSAN